MSNFKDQLYYENGSLYVVTGETKKGDLQLKELKTDMIPRRFVVKTLHNNAESGKKIAKVNQEAIKDISNKEYDIDDQDEFISQMQILNDSKTQKITIVHDKTIFSDAGNNAIDEILAAIDPEKHDLIEDKLIKLMDKAADGTARAFEKMYGYVNNKMQEEFESDEVA